MPALNNEDDTTMNNKDADTNEKTSDVFPMSTVDDVIIKMTTADNESS